MRGDPRDLALSPHADGALCADLFRGCTLVLDLGRVVQIDPIKPMLKAPGTVLSKLEHDEALSNYAFKFKLRRCTSAATALP